MRAVRVASVDKAQRRRLALQRFIDELRRSTGDPSGASSVFEVDGISVTLDGWALETARRSWQPNAAERQGGLGVEASELLTHSLAYALRSGVNAVRMRLETGSTGAGFYALQAELMLDSGLGQALLRELQAAVDGLVQQGALEQAKQLSRFQHQIRKVARSAQESLDASEQGRASSLANSLTDCRESTTSGTAQLDAVARSLAREHDRARLEARKRARVLGALQLPGLTEILFVALTLIFVFYFGVELLPRMFGQPAEPLERSDFLSSAPIVDLVSRTPSLYVTVEESAWNRMSESDRLELVEGIGSTLRAHEYTGAHLQTPERRAVARWLLHRGASLLPGDDAPKADAVVAASR